MAHTGRFSERAKLYYLCEGAAVAALYVVLTWLSNALGLASGVPQCRLSEALCVLPLWIPAAVPGLGVGCLLANFITGSTAPDLVVGSLATLAGAWLCSLYGRRRSALRLPDFILATLPNALLNSFLLPPVLQYAYHLETGYWALVLEIGAGELISGVVLGTLLAVALPKKLLKRNYNKSKDI